MTPATPGECHPALTEYADAVRTTNRDPVLIAAPPREDTLLSLDADPMVPAFRTLTLRRQTAAFSLYTEYGSYVWDVWVDDLGRQVAGEHARWVENPSAMHLPPFGHGPLQTPEQAAAERHDRAAARDREYLEAVIRDYTRAMAVALVVLIVAVLIGAFL